MAEIEKEIYPEKLTAKWEAEHQFKTAKFIRAIELAREAGATTQADLLDSVRFIIEAGVHPTYAVQIITHINNPAEDFGS